MSLNSELNLSLIDFDGKGSFHCLQSYPDKPKRRFKGFHSISSWCLLLITRVWACIVLHCFPSWWNCFHSSAYYPSYVILQPSLHVQHIAIDQRFGCQHFITIVSSRLVNGLLNRGSQWHNIIRMFVCSPIFSGWVRHSLHFTKSIPTEYHLLISRFPSSLCQIAKSSLQSHHAHFCQIVHFISPSLPTPHHQC